jgi:RND family efflux transporter MFP subunit
MIQSGTSSQTQAMPIVRLSQNDRLRLVIPVPESAVSRIRLGQPVEVAVQSLHKTVTGTVARFADRLDTATRTMHVEVDVQNQNSELVPGMYADASMTLERASGVVVAPVQAVDRSEKDARVLAIGRDGTLQSRVVTLGLEADDRVEVKNGLSEGDLVVVGSRAQLRPGTVVTPKIATPSPSGER